MGDFAMVMYGGEGEGEESTLVCRDCAARGKGGG